MSEKQIQRPHGHDDSVFIVSVSGGKDSTATVLALREAEIHARYVFSDTGWEAPETYEYLDTLTRVLGITIDRVGVPGGMLAKIEQRAGFPARMQRWCTRELKVLPIREYHDRVGAETDADTVSVTGIRAEESSRRAAMPAFEYDERWGGYVWRPLMDWAVSDVLAIHHRHGVPIHPLYRVGFSRVGCWPCIYSNKADVKLWAETDPQAVENLADLERATTAERARRNAEEPGRYKHPQATYFQSRVQNHDGTYSPMTVREVVAWARTDRGGRQLPLVQEQPDTGCFRWGLCDAPSGEEAA